ncbi:MAG TPA: hypothetical protein VKC61_22205 [Pyrinomonadaceae bacterium]|nr:hypothetical protein [Pyrinomonadaceae bacterium]
MKRALDSFAFGVLCSLMLLALSLVTTSYTLPSLPLEGDSDKEGDRIT